MGVKVHLHAVLWQACRTPCWAVCVWNPRWIIWGKILYKKFGALCYCQPIKMIGLLRAFLNLYMLLRLFFYNCSTVADRQTGVSYTSATSEATSPSRYTKALNEARQRQPATELLFTSLISRLRLPSHYHSIMWKGFVATSPSKLLIPHYHAMSVTS